MTKVKCSVCGNSATKLISINWGFICLRCNNVNVKPKKQNKHEEDDMQAELFKNIPMFFPNIPTKLIFAVPNGGYRSALEGARLKKQGVKAGVADIILLIPRHGFNCLCIELKTKIGKQSDEQKEFEKQIVNAGGKYIIARSVHQAIQEIASYMKKIKI